MLDGRSSIFSKLSRHTALEIQPSSPTPLDSEPPPPTGRSTALSPTPNSATSDPQRRSLSARFARQIAMISPRSGNYDRLEGGMGPSRVTSPSSLKRFGWKKFAVGAVILIGIVWLFGPREHRFSWRSKPKPSPEVEYDDDIEVNVPSHPEPPHSNQPPTSSKTHPTSYDTDPDPLKTTYCTSAYNPVAHIVQYALMIDAGSTGSRVHIYKFNNCGPSPFYEYEVFKMTQPGLSAYPGRPLEAAESLDVLLDEAVRIVPEVLHHCTPVAVKATAGLRMLAGRQSHDIIEYVEQRLKEKFPFQLQEKDGVVIMEGKDEGVYAWITANYLLGAITPGSTTAKDKDSSTTSTYAVLDLGGASTQIVFEPSFASSDMMLEDGEHKYDLQFGGKNYVLYQHSYLGYGLMKARSHVHRLVDFMASIRPGAVRPQAHDSVPNPCLAQGTRRRVEIQDEVTGVKRNVTMEGDTVGSFEACDRILQLVLAKDAICELKPCSFNGVYQPSLLHSFANGKVLLLSYFYDRLSPLLPSPSSSTSQPPLTVSTFASIARTVCLGRSAWVTQSWASDTNLMDELDGRPEWCLDLTFMHALLRLGYEFEDARRLEVGKKIGGTELGWCLGATIAMVGGDLRCRI